MGTESDDPEDGSSAGDQIEDAANEADPTTVRLGEQLLHVPETATRAEAAALAAALSAHVTDQEAAAAAGGGDTKESWDGDRFAFAGRLAAVTGESGRVPGGTPTDPWTAAGRRERF